MLLLLGGMKLDKAKDASTVRKGLGSDHAECKNTGRSDNGGQVDTL